MYLANALEHFMGSQTNVQLDEYMFVYRSTISVKRQTWKMWLVNIAICGSTNRSRNKWTQSQTGPHIVSDIGIAWATADTRILYTGDAAPAADVAARDVDDVTSDVSLNSRHDADSESSDDVTAGCPAEVIVEGQQMNKVGHV